MGFGEVNEHADAAHPLGLLRPRRERPREGRAAEQRDEKAPPHSSTASALIGQGRIVGRIVIVIPA
jgi:hypothetical protein